MITMLLSLPLLQTRRDLRTRRGIKEKREEKMACK
jgi:hypothetical protein